jgi:hypothetical protein
MAAVGSGVVPDFARVTLRVTLRGVISEAWPNDDFL